MKIMATSFKRSHTHTAALSAPDPSVGHRWTRPPSETPGHSWANLSQFLVRFLLLSPGSWCVQGFVCALQESVAPVLWKFWWFYSGINGDLLQEGLCHYPGLLHPELLPLWQATADPYLHTQRQVWLSLCGVSCCAQGFVWALWASLVGMGFVSECNFTPLTILLGLLLCPWTWGIFFWWDPTFSCRRLLSSAL